MSIIKKTAAAVIMFMLAVPLAAGAYSDISADCKYSSAVEKMTALGVMSGYEDGTFRPEKNISRSEAAVMFVRILHLTPDASENQFRDVPAEHWAKGEIETAASFGIINGTESGIFMPDTGLKKLQAAVIVLNTMGFKGEAQLKGGYPGGYRSLASDKNLFKSINGSEDDVITRGEFATMLANALDEPIMTSD